MWSVGQGAGSITFARIIGLRASESSRSPRRKALSLCNQVIESSVKVHYGLGLEIPLQQSERADLIPGLLRSKSPESGIAS